MKKYAEVISGTVVLVQEFADSHIPQAALPVQFIELPDDHQVMPGDTYTGQEFFHQPEDTQRLVDANISMLWQCAHDYEFACINGSAIGILTMGTMLQKPKSLAVTAWIQSIWGLYYQRKPMVTSVRDTSLFDFSMCGPMPYSVPELIAEVMVGA